MLRGDALGILTARALAADAVAAPVNVSTALERSGWFARTRRTRIGSPYVVEAAAALAAEGARLAVGFEANGGFLLAGAADARRPPRSRRCRPATPCCRCWRSWPRRRATSRPLSAVLGDAAGARNGERPAASRSPRPPRGRCWPARRLGGRPRRLRRDGSPARQSSAVDRTDGLRMTLASGEILHLRPSGNAPELRCYAEAADEARAESLAAAMLAEVAARLADAP